jgi:TPR repeat protein
MGVPVDRNVKTAVPPSDEEHVAIATKRAARGDMRAMYTMGIWRATGRMGVPVDMDAAVRLITAASAKDYAPALYTQGFWYQNGKGVAKDYARALDCFSRGATLEHPPSMCQFGLYHLLGKVVAKDEAQAYLWLGRAQQAGCQHVFFVLGGLYAEGRGVTRDVGRAADYFRRMKQCTSYPLPPAHHAHVDRWLERHAPSAAPSPSPSP